MQPSAPPSAASEVLIGAAGNLIGGFLATLLWWFATSLMDKRRAGIEVQQKRNAISVEIAKVTAWLRVLKEDPACATTAVPGRPSGVLAALVRLGPDITPGRSLEPQLGMLEHRLATVEALGARHFHSTAGMAAALRGNDEEVEELRTSLAGAADAALLALGEFERAALVL